MNTLKSIHYNQNTAWDNDVYIYSLITNMHSYYIIVASVNPRGADKYFVQFRGIFQKTGYISQTWLLTASVSVSV